MFVVFATLWLFVWRAAAQPSTWSDLLVLDCQANLHAAVGTPIEAHLALPALNFLANAFAARVRERVACVRDNKCPSLTDTQVETFLVPSVAMVLNALRAPADRLRLPEPCMTSVSTNDGLPAFGSSFWSDASVVTLLGLLNVNYHTPAYMQLPSSCSYDSWVAGQPCTFQLDAGTIAGSQLQVAIGHCPASAGTPAGARGESALPSVSISCNGAWCANLFAPCATAGSVTECGGSGTGGSVQLVCRTLDTGFQNDGGFAALLRELRLIPDSGPSPLEFCRNAALSGIDSFILSLRTQLALLTGRPPPPPTSTPQQALLFCAPSANDIDNRLWPWVKDQLGATISEAQIDLSGCAASGCDLLNVGDGVCQMECHSAICRWDGNDCGGVGRVVPPVVDSSLFRAAQWEDAQSLSPAQRERINFWEDCAGWPSFWFSPCVCWGTPLPPALDCGVNCIFCLPPRVVNSTVQPIPDRFRLSGAEAFVVAWDGQLPNSGGSALSPDRTSGAAWAARTPAVLPPVGTGVPAGYEAVLQSSCEGALSFAPFNRNLGIALSMPLLQRGSAWAATWVKEMQTCVAQTLGFVPLSDAQFELRWMPHHLANWAYQLLSMDNTGSAVASGAQTLLRKVGAASAIALGFGDRRLASPWVFLAAEPTPSPQNPNGDVSDEDLLNSAWSRQGRMRPPTASCSFETASPLGANPPGSTNNMARRCSASWAGGDSLIASPPGTAAFFGDIAQDVCGGTILPPTGSATQSPSNTGDGFPSFALWAQGAGAAMLRSPTPCTSNADCSGFGAGTMCLNPDSFLSNSGGLRATLPGRNKDFVGMFVQGPYSAAMTPAQSTCSNVEAFLSSARATVISVAEGFNAAAPTPTPSPSLQFCFYNVQGAINRAQSWWQSEFQVCSQVSGPGQSCLDWPTLGRTPAVLQGFSSLPEGVELVARGARGAYNPASADPPRANAAVPTAHFTLTLSLAPLTQGALDVIRDALITAINRLGIAITPGGLTVFTVAPPTGGGATTSLTFEVLLVDATQQAQLLTQLSGTPGTLAATLGPTLAGLGGVTAAVSAAGVTVSNAGAGAAPRPPSSSDGPSILLIVGASVGGFLGVAAVAVAVWICRARRRKGSQMAKPASLSTPTSESLKRAAELTSVKSELTSVKSLDKADSEAVVSANPLSVAAAAASADPAPYFAADSAPPPTFLFRTDTSGSSSSKPDIVVPGGVTEEASPLPLAVSSPVSQRELSKEPRASPRAALTPPSLSLTSVTSSVVIIELVESVAPGVPFVAPILLLLAAALRKLERMGLTSGEAQRLQQRLQRLGALMKTMSDDSAFVERHDATFAGLLSGLKNADDCLSRIASQSSLAAFASSSRNLELIASLDRDLSERLQELTAAQGAETLSALRATSELTAATLSAVRELSPPPQSPVALPPPLPLPPPPRLPFSMSLSLSDFAFDVPLAVQLETAPRGSFGTVVFATWVRERLAVAIKLLPVRGAAGEALRPGAWLEEAEHMRRLSEGGSGGAAAEHVVRLYGIGADSTHFLVVMERLETSLRAALDGYLSAGRHPAIATALRWVLDTARGCAECHRVRVVHGDVKAANTLLTAERTAKLGDLGSARVTRGIAGTQTRGAAAATVAAGGAGGARGSFLWTAPELLDDPTAAPSFASDVYAWAVVAWEVLSRHLPYHDATGAPVINLERLAVRVDIVRGALRPDLALVRADAPRALVALIQRAWDSDPRARPTMEDIVAELARGSV